MSQSLRLALIPLDERHWVSDAPVKLGRIAGCEVVLPPRHMLATKKQAGRFDELGDWLAETAGSVDGIVIAMETMAYGGLIASRTSDHSLETAEAYIAVLRDIKEQHPDVPIYAFTLVMRIPAYDSDDQEPHYWATHGRRIHLYSQLVDKVGRHDREEDRQALQALKDDIPKQYLADWHRRRDRNHELSMTMLDYVAAGTIDFLLITQDDSTEYGVSAMEQRALRAKIARLGIEERAIVYPGADEVAMVLVARHINVQKGKRPLFYPIYSSTNGPFIIPSYEDRPLAESVKGQVYAVGGRLVETPGEADILLFLNTAAEAQTEASRQRSTTAVNTAGRNVLAFTEAMLHYGEQGKLAAVADVAYANGADGEFVRLLLRRVGLAGLMAYGAWNTAGNTLGTVVAHASVYEAVGRDVPREQKLRAAREHMEFLLQRFIEDWLYQAVLRPRLVNEELPRLGINPYRLGDDWQRTEKIVAKALIDLASETFADAGALQLHWYGENVGVQPAGFRLDNIRQPWERMFNVAFDVVLDVAGSDAE